MKKKLTLLISLLFLPTNIAYSDSLSSNITGDLTANVGIVSDYVFHGISQSDEHPALQGGIDYNHPNGLYLGAWASQTDFNDNDEGTVEVDLYGGYASDWNNISYDLSIIHYVYPGASNQLNYDFTELTLSFSKNFKETSFGVGFNYSPEYFGDSGDALYSQLSFERSVPYDLTFSGHIGYQDIDDEVAFGTPDYADWRLSLGYNLKGFNLDLAYTDTDLNTTECSDGCEGRFILSLTKEFNLITNN